MKVKDCLSKCSKYNVLVLRILIGLTFILNHGIGKILSGPAGWAKLGAFAGFTVFPVFWGLLAALSEFVGAVLILLGLWTRYAAFFLGFTMLTAIVTAHRADLLSLNWQGFELALVFLFVCISLMFSGAGQKWNLEKHLFGKEL